MREARVGAAQLGRQVRAQLREPLDVRLVDHPSVGGHERPRDACPVEARVDDGRAVLAVRGADDAARVRRHGMAVGIEGVARTSRPVDADRVRSADLEQRRVDREVVALALHRERLQQPVGIVAVEDPQLHGRRVVRPDREAMPGGGALDASRSILCIRHAL
jgi:hypothetical protein